MVQLPVLKCPKCKHEWIPRKSDSHFCPICNTCIYCGIQHPRSRPCRGVKPK